MAEFHELRGDYVENVGQSISLREYLDYFEPLGSALSRMPHGSGGPFVYHFTDSGGRTIGSLGWVVSSAAKRFGGWKLWGMWANRPIPAVALPLFWSALSDPDRAASCVARANDDAERLLDREQWPELLDEVSTARLHDEAFRESLKAELARAYAVKPPFQQSMEVELTPSTLDLLPWLYLLGPVDPATARLQPNAFRGAGYQYIVSDQPPPRAHAEVRREIETMVDAAASDVVGGWEMASELRAFRARPPKAAAPAVPRPQRTPRAQPQRAQPQRREKQKTEVHEVSPAPATKPIIPRRDLWTDAWKIAVLLLLAWIGWNVHLLRKGAASHAVMPEPVEVTQTATTATEPEPEPEPEDERTRVRRIAAALEARPPRAIRVSDTVLNEIARGGTGAPEQLARVAVEIALRVNGCVARAELVDGRFSTAEQRAIRNCTAVRNERLLASGVQPDTERSLAYVEQLTR